MEHQSELSEFVMAREASELLGVSRSWIEGRLRSGAIPCVRIGSLRRIRRADIDRILQEGLPKNP